MDRERENVCVCVWKRDSTCCVYWYQPYLRPGQPSNQTETDENHNFVQKSENETKVGFYKEKFETTIFAIKKINRFDEYKRATLFSKGSMKEHITFLVLWNIC